MMTVDILSLLCIAGAAQLFTMAAVFATSRALPQRTFAAFALNVGIIITGSVLMGSVAPLARAHVPFNYLLGPLFYLFVRATLMGELGRRVWLHAIPAAIAAVSLIAFQPSARTFLIALLVQAVGYIAATFLLLARHDRADRTLWIGAWTFAAICAGAFARLAGAISPRVIPAMLAVAAVVVAAALLRGRVADRKYVRSTLQDDRAELLLRRLLELFQSEKPYLDPELSLDALSRKLSIPPKHLSQIVNQQLGRNFNDWINGWRVEEAKRRLVDQKHGHLSIVAIGEASGFRSKSTFNAAFRRETSMTPSEFRRQRPD